MKKLLNNSDISELTIIENTLFTKIGYSLTIANLKILAKSIATFCGENNYPAICLGNDGNTFTKEFCESFIKDVAALGLKVIVPDKTVSSVELSWLCSENKRIKTLGIYFTHDTHDHKYISLLFFNNFGEPVTNKTVKNIISSSSKTVSEILNREELDIDYVDLTSYRNFLIDKKLINPSLFSQTVSIDTMFGASLNLIQTLDSSKSFIFYNKNFDLPRIQNYVQKPIGGLLKWHTTSNLNATNIHFFGLDGDGDSLGVFDLKQNLELTPSSVSILLLKSLSYKYKTGDVYLSKLLSKKVKEYAKILGYTVIEAKTHLNEALISNKEKALL